MEQATKPVEASVSDRMANMTTGYFVSQMIGVVAELGIADLLKDGPRESDQLAKSVGASPDALYRVMRALASVGIFSEVGDRCFQLTPLADCLRTGVPGSMRSWARAVTAISGVRGTTSSIA